MSEIIEMHKIPKWFSFGAWRYYKVKIYFLAQLKLSYICRNPFKIENMLCIYREKNYFKSISKIYSYRLIQECRICNYLIILSKRKSITKILYFLICEKWFSSEEFKSIDMVLISHTKCNNSLSYILGEHFPIFYHITIRTVIITGRSCMKNNIIFHKKS